MCRSPDVADADLAGARRHGLVQWHRRCLGHALGGEAQRGQQLQRRVVGQPHHRQQRRALQQAVGAHLAHWLVHRPGALLLAQVHIVLDHAGLRRLQQQALLERGLGLGVVAHLLEQPADVVPGMHLQVGRGRGGNHRAPFVQRGIVLA
jgi:hypothetical protein